MAQENQVSIKITPEDIEQIKTAINTIEEKLKAHLIALTAEERRELPKMSDKTAPFVEKVLDYAENNPNFAPAYLDVAELKTDLEAVDTLNNFLRPLEQLVSGLNDTVLLSGSEAYIAALAYYNSVKLAAKMNVPDAKTIYEDLSPRFPGRPRK